MIPGSIDQLCVNKFLNAQAYSRSTTRDKVKTNTDLASKSLCANTLGILSFLKDRYHIKALYGYIFDNNQRELIDNEIDSLMPTLDSKERELLDSYRSYIKNDNMPKVLAQSDLEVSAQKPSI